MAARAAAYCAPAFLHPAFGANSMNIHEYQAKEVLRGFGVPVPNGKAAFTVEEAVAAAKDLPGPVWVVKAQIHAGGRGKGGGVKVVKSIEDVKKEAQRMLGMTLVTHQTGPAGRLVKRLYIEDGSAIERELYLSALVDRATSRIAFIVSTEGGMDIEEVAHKTPEKIHTFQIEPAAGYSPYVGNEIAVALGVKGDAAKQIGKVVKGLYDAFIAKDMSLLEINPLVVTKDGNIICLDAKLNFDDNSLYRHKDIQALRDLDEEDPAEVEASEIRPLLYQAGWRDRLHGQWRGPGHGDHGHHQAVWQRAGQLPGRGRRRHQGKSHPGLQDHRQRSQREGHPGQYLRRHHEMRHHRRRHRRRGEGDLAAGAAGGAPGRHQCRIGQGNTGQIGPGRSPSADNLADAAEKVVKAVKGSK